MKYARTNDSAANSYSADNGGNLAPFANVGDGAARDLLTVEQAARYLHLSTSSIRAYMRQGTLKAFRIAGLRKVLIPRAELLALLEPARADPADIADGADGADDAPARTSLARQPIAHAPTRLTK